MLTFRRIFCKHTKTIYKVAGQRLYTECLHCGMTSPGILTGTTPPAPAPTNPFRAHSTAFRRIED